VPSEDLYVSERPADRRDLPSGVRDEGTASRVRRASSEPELLVPDEEEVHDGLSGDGLGPLGPNHSTVWIGVTLLGVEVVQCLLEVTTEGDDPTRRSLTGAVEEVDGVPYGPVWTDDHRPGQVGDLPRSKSRSNREKNDGSVPDGITSTRGVGEDRLDLTLREDLCLFGQGHSVAPD